MKKLVLSCLTALVLFACQTETKKTPTTSSVVSDSTAIAQAIHGFFQWYDPYVNDDSKGIDFTKVVGKHLVLDQPLFEKYLAAIKSSGFISSEFLDNERAYYKTCEKLWQQEEGDGVPTGMDANKYFCAQDWDINFWIKSPVRIKPLGNDKVSATLYGLHGESALERNFELKKENGQWLLTKIECDMGINVQSK